MESIFFKIIFQIEPGSNEDNFKGVVVFLRNRFLGNLQNHEGLKSKLSPPNEREEVYDYIMDLIAQSFVENREIEFINDDNIKCVNKKINIVLNKINSYEMWHENINYFTDELKMQLRI